MWNKENVVRGVRNGDGTLKGARSTWIVGKTRERQRRYMRGGDNTRGVEMVCVWVMVHEGRMRGGDRA
jgi:hypothetical protein